MELLNKIAELVPTVGFPIICAAAMAWFIYRIYCNTTKQNNDNMAAVQARCKEREERLYEQLEKQNEINGRFAQIIAQYEIKLDIIQTDINDIKQVVLNK